MMFADRSVAMGDPRFVKINLERLLSKEYGRELAQKIDMDCAKEYAPSEGIEAKSYPGCTTSFQLWTASEMLLCRRRPFEIGGEAAW